MASGQQQKFCECPHPICNNCQLQIKSSTETKSTMQTVKRELLHSGNLAPVSDDRLHRCINYTISTFQYFSDTRTALEEQKSRDIILSTFFNEMGYEFEPMRYFLRVLKLREENQLIILKLQDYSRMLGEEDDDNDGDLTPCIQCSSPPKSPGENVQFSFLPPLLYVHNEYQPGMEIEPVEVRAEEQGSS